MVLTLKYLRVLNISSLGKHICKLRYFIYLKNNNIFLVRFCLILCSCFFSKQ
jgi:hypothetical protein